VRLGVNGNLCASLAFQTPQLLAAKVLCYFYRQARTLIILPRRMTTSSLPTACRLDAS